MMSLKISLVLLMAFAAIALAKPKGTEPPPLVCAEDEVYFKCELIQCYQTCEQLVKLAPCPSIDPGCFKPACLCMGHLLRNEAGKCVPVDQCSQNFCGAGNCTYT